MIVTGGSSGIGFEAALSIAKREPLATIIIASRDANRVEHAVRAVRDQVVGAAVYVVMFCLFVFLFTFLLQDRNGARFESV